MKKRLLATLLLCFLIPSINPALAQCEDVTIESLSNPGPYTVAMLTEDDGLRNGPDYQGATVYYPTDAQPPFTSIAIVPGFTAQPSSVEEWGPFYASHGIVAIIIGTNSIFDFPEARAIALLDALETMRQENTRETSPLEDKLDINRFAVSGWSMGGGGAQRAAVLDNTIRGVVALCPYLPNPALEHESPVLILSGQNDNIAPPSQHANLHYEATPDTTNKLLFEIENGNHSVANTPNGGNGKTGQLALSWLKLYVEENNCYCPLLTDSLLDNPEEASLVQTNIECEPILGMTNFMKNIAIFPNPTQNIVTVAIQSDVAYSVYNPLGQVLQKGKLSGNNKNINLSTYPKGVYYLKIENKTHKILKN